MESSNKTRTWDDLVAALEAAIKWGREIATSAPDYFASHNVQRSLDGNLALYDVLQRLRKHPVLGNYVPYLAVSEFRWTPTEESWLALDTKIDRSHYRITLKMPDKDPLQTIVTIDEVIPTLLDYLARASGISGIA